MNASANSETSLTLLKRLSHHPLDERAWQEFVARYDKKIMNWCRYWNLQEADAADVTQCVLLKLSKDISKYEKRDGGYFRAWLKTLAHHAWYDLVQSHQHKMVKGGAEFEKTIESMEARDDLAAQLEATWDQELLLAASDRVRLRVHPKTWKSFRLTAIDGLGCQEAADRLEMTLAAVYKAKSNVLKLLQEEVTDIERTEFDG